MSEVRPGVWRLRVYRGHGKYRSETFRGDAKQAARRLDRFRIEVEDERPDPGTVGELIGRWLDLKRHDLSPTTLHGYEVSIRLYIRPRFGAMNLADLRGRDLDALYLDMLAGKTASEKPASPGTVRQVHAVLRNALGQAVKWELIAANPALAASPPRLRKYEATPPSPDAINAALKAATATPDLEMFFRIAAVTGARRGEIVALKWGDFDFDEAVVTMAHSVAYVPGKPLIYKDTKTGKAKRLALGPGMVARLEAFRRLQVDRAARNRVTLVADPFVFASAPDGSRPWRPDFATKQWAATVVAAGIPKARLHDVRHAVATRMLGAGDDVVTVAAQLGHSSPSTTLNIYAHLLPEKNRAAANRDDDQFG